MDLKKATLLALIGSILYALSGLYGMKEALPYMIGYLAENSRRLFIEPTVAFLLGLALINFFYSLYKKQ